MADLTGIPWDQFPENAAMNDKVSSNFTLYELIRSDTAERAGIDNQFASVHELRAAVYICRNVLQKVRDQFGSFTPNSVYRSQALERVLKRKPADWVSHSQHAMGQACDIEVNGESTLGLAKWVEENLTFDQLICECYNQAKGPNSGWVHVSIKPPGTEENRGEVLSYIYDKTRGKYVYVKGLVESPQ